MRNQQPLSSLNLRVGDWVEVKSVPEILATLDANGCVEALPFMPEMLRHCGRRYRVLWSAHKTADTIELFSIRRLSNAVHLADLRCDGAVHGGCQAGCLFFWKECWLKSVSGPFSEVEAVSREHKGRHHADEISQAEAKLLPSAKVSRLPGQPECYRCQATEMLNATTEVRGRDRLNPFFYVRDLTSGNVTLFDFIRFGAFAMLNAFLARWFGFRLPRVRGLAGEKTPSCETNLQPGDYVRVKPKAEIERTLNRQRRNRGMWFDVEMVPFCGRGPFRVLRRVERIINEKTGKLMTLPNPCIILEDVTCSGNYSSQRMFSRRNEYPYWREIWLERVDEDHGKNCPVGRGHDDAASPKTAGKLEVERE